jgi:nucleotide-binding universal stress UspA family protein
MKILLCIRGRVHGEHSAGFVGRLARGAEIDCTVLYVNPESKTFRGQKYPTPHTEEEIDAFMSKVGHILKNSGIEKVSTIIRDGEPAKEILQESGKGYQMVVTGTRGAKGLDRRLFETVSYRVAENAKIPVLVVREEAVKHERILVATDGSEASGEAVYCCGYLAEKLGFSVNVLSVAPVQEGADDSEAAVKEAKGTLEKEFGIKAEGKVAIGPPSEEILKESENKDLVVMGSRGIGSIKRLLVGHVSREVLADEDTNVMIVRNCKADKKRQA